MAQELALQLIETKQDIQVLTYNLRMALDEASIIFNQITYIRFFVLPEILCPVTNLSPEELLIHNENKKNILEDFEQKRKNHELNIARYGIIKKKLDDAGDRLYQIEYEMKKLREQYIWQNKENTVQPNIMSAFLSKIKK